MPVKKCKLSLFIKFYYLSIFLTWKFVINGQSNYQEDSLAIFSDNIVSDLENFINFTSQYNHLTFNDPSLKRFEANPLSFCSNTLIKMIAINNNYTLNAIESNRKYISCRNLKELICNPLIKRKVIVTQTIFDCDENIKINDFVQNVNDSNLIRIISLSSSIRQIQIVLTGLMNRFSIYNYAIIYSNPIQSDFFKSLAGYLVYKFSIDSKFNLEFSLSIEDTRIGSVLNDSLKSNIFYFKPSYIFNRFFKILSNIKLHFLGFNKFKNLIN